MAGAMLPQWSMTTKEVTMVSKKEEMNRWIRDFREKEDRDLSADEISTMLESVGWPMPKPKTAHEMLAKQVAEAQAEEMIYDDVLNDSVNRNICYPVESDGKQIMLWAELDTATRKKVEKNKTLRRDQSVGDIYQGTLICMRWSRLHPNEQPVLFDADFVPDMEWRLSAKQAKGKAA